jgi:hypothetical protein
VGCLLVAPLVLRMAGFPLNTQSPADARTAIEAAYRRADAAYVAARTIQDLEAVREWLDTPDCVYTEFGQPPRTWAEMRRYAVEGLRTTIVSFRSTIERFEVADDRAVATTVVAGVARIEDRDGRFGQRGATHAIETTATVRDEWVRRDRWRRQSHTKIVANHVTAVDGKPLNR